MLQDNCILVDERDVITGSANKYDSHRFIAAQPQGLLHRAFSVFLFDSQGRLLLQQRAKDKITFPGGFVVVCAFGVSRLARGHSDVAVLAGFVGQLLCGAHRP